VSRRSSSKEYLRNFVEISIVREVGSLKLDR